MIVKFRLSEDKEWDRTIIQWINSIPHGYRSAAIKKLIYTSINNSPSNLKKAPSPTPDKDSEEIDRKIKSILKW